MVTSDLPGVALRMRVLFFVAVQFRKERTPSKTPPVYKIYRSMMPQAECKFLKDAYASKSEEPLRKTLHN